MKRLWQLPRCKSRIEYGCWPRSHTGARKGYFGCFALVLYSSIFPIGPVLLECCAQLHRTVRWDGARLLEILRVQILSLVAAIALRCDTNRGRDESAYVWNYAR